MIPRSTKGENYGRENSFQINKLRGLIRKTAYLLHPFEDLEHKSISGTTLQGGLRSFELSAQANMLKYVRQQLADGEKCKLVPIYVTEEELQEASKVENLTKAEIQIKIFQMMDQLDIDVSSFYEEVFNKTEK